MIPHSTVDWPGELAAVVFCQGCCWRCRYCHNPHLGARAAGAIAWTDVARWLERRRGILDAVVFSGGEPLLQEDLPAAARVVRSLGFRVGLHTGGGSPGLLGRVVPYLDWVGLDIKAPFERYQRVTGTRSGARVRASLRLLRKHGVPMEVRTTWHPELLDVEDLRRIGVELAGEGCREWVIQRFRPEGCRDAELCRAATGPVPVADLADIGLLVAVR